MSDFDDMSPLERILSRGNPRTHEYGSVMGKIRRHERKKALDQIMLLYAPCTPIEAEMVYAALRECAVGQKGTLIEIAVDEIISEANAWSAANTNPLIKHLTFVARAGSRLGALNYGSGGQFYLNSGMVQKAQLDQVWKFVPLK